jgi:hypothetical protein
VLAVGIVAVLLWRSRPSLSAALVTVVVGLSALAVANAAFAVATDNTESSLAALDIEPAASLVAFCGLIGGGGVEVDLSWTVSPGQRPFSGH